jgi:hypothetical protein
MSNLENRNAARINEGTNTPLYPNLGPAVAKHRRLNDETPEGRKAYGQAVLKAINSLNRGKLRQGFNPSSPCASGTWHSEGKDILKAIRAQHRTATQAAANGPTFERTEDELERDYYRAMLESRGVDPNKIVNMKLRLYERELSSYEKTTWLKAAWNVIKTKRGTPYLAEAKAAEPAPQPEAIEPAPQPKKRGRPFGSKNKPKLVAGPVKPAELPKPSKPRVPSHYLSSASSVAYHAAM